MIFAMPTIQLLIMPMAANFDVKNVNLAIVDNDHSNYSQKLITKIGSSGYFNIAASPVSYKQALPFIDKEKADVIMEIPYGFERNLVKEGSQKIALSVDAINGTKAQLGGSYLTTVINDFNDDIKLMCISPQKFNKSPVLDITFSNWFNTRAEYKLFMVPAIMVLLLTMVGGFLSALNIVREKEIGTIEQINVSPVKKWQFILGKLIPFWIMGIVVFTIGLLIARFVYGIIPAGSIALLYLFAAVYLIAVLGFGLLVSTYSNTQLQAMFVAFFFIMIFMLMSGLFTSVDSMPKWAQTISYCTPVTHFIEVMRMIVLKGSGFDDVKMKLLYEVGFAVLLNGWAIRNYRKTS